MQFYEVRYSTLRLNFYLTVAVLAAKSTLKQGRKLLQKVVGEQSKNHDVGHDLPPKEKKNDPTTFSTGKQVGLVATGIVVMSCGLMCPCFYRKRKPTAHSVLAKDPNSSEFSISITSFNIWTNYFLDNFKGMIH